MSSSPLALTLHFSWKPLEDILEDVHTYGVLAWKTQINEESEYITYFYIGFTFSRPKRRRCAHLPGCLPASSRKNAVGVHKNQNLQGAVERAEIVYLGAASKSGTVWEGNHKQAPPLMSVLLGAARA